MLFEHCAEHENYSGALIVDICWAFVLATCITSDCGIAVRFSRHGVSYDELFSDGAGWVTTLREVVCVRILQILRPKSRFL